jgi:hypothetical protein
MMGERTVMQETLFCGFSLERHVPSDHMLTQGRRSRAAGWSGMGEFAAGTASMP